KNIGLTNNIKQLISINNKPVKYTTNAILPSELLQTFSLPVIANNIQYDCRPALTKSRCCLDKVSVSFFALETSYDGYTCDFVLQLITSLKKTDLCQIKARKYKARSRTTIQACAIIAYKAISQ